jgi:hypothetical protein
MSLFQTVNTIKDEALNSVVCPIMIRLGVQAIPAASLLVGEVTFSYLLHYGVILPSPIGIELMEFPARMIYILENRKMRLSLLPKLWLLLSSKASKKCSLQPKYFHDLIRLIFS